MQVSAIKGYFARRHPSHRKEPPQIFFLLLDLSISSGLVSKMDHPDGLLSKPPPFKERGWEEWLKNLFAHFLLEGGCERRDNLKQVADHTVARQLEYGRLRIFVDGYDHFAGAHTSQMLDRP